MRAKHSLTLILTLVASACVAASAQGVESVYTTLNFKKCKTLEESDDRRLSECPGVAGYKLHMEAVNDSLGLTVVRPDGSKHALNIEQVGAGKYPETGPRAEWRVRRERGRLVPIALIVRVSVYEFVGGDRQYKLAPYLSVAKITPEKICSLEPMAAGRNANVAARRLADNSADKPCYGFSYGGP